MPRPGLRSTTVCGGGQQGNEERRELKPRFQPDAGDFGLAKILTPDDLASFVRQCILKEATGLYGESWVTTISPELRPNEYK